MGGVIAGAVLISCAERISDDSPLCEDALHFEFVFALKGLLYGVVLSAVIVLSRKFSLVVVLVGGSIVVLDFRCLACAGLADVAQEIH